MPIDGKGMAQLLWDAIVNGIIWMFTIKYPDDAQFALWIILWLITTMSLLFGFMKFTKVIKHDLFD